jgi:hypothetical protein
MNEQKSVYETLSEVNVNEFVKGKNGFKYLSWAHAVNSLLSKYPSATWEVKTWDNMPYLITDAGAFVEVTVTIGDISRSQLHPILDFRNKTVKTPDSFQVNTSIQRALAKAISLHGLGLYIYQGEDLPLSEQDALNEMRLEIISLLDKKGELTNEKKIYIQKASYEILSKRLDELRRE